MSLERWLVYNYSYTIGSISHFRFSREDDTRFYFELECGMEECLVKSEHEKDGEWFSDLVSAAKRVVDNHTKRCDRLQQAADIAKQRLEGAWEEKRQAVLVLSTLEKECGVILV